MTAADPLLHLLARLGEEGVEYVLVGGQAVRLNGFLRATEDVDLLVRASRENGERIKRALDLFAANGETYDSVQADVREIEIEGVRIRVLSIDGLLKTKTSTREKDILDRSMLERIKRDIGDRH